MERRSSQKTALRVILALFIGGVLGWAVGSFVTPMSNESISTGTVPGIGGGPGGASNVGPYRTTTADFRVEIDSLLKEHGVLVAEYLKIVYDRKDTSAIKSQIDQNTENIGSIIGRAYGGEFKNQFIDSWNGHIEEYVNYTRALRDNNNEAKSKARTALLSHAEEMGRLFNQIDGNFSAQRISTLMNEHMQLTLNIIEAYVSNDNTALANNMKAAYAQAGQVANYIGQVIFSSRPERI